MADMNALAGAPPAPNPDAMPGSDGPQGGGAPMGGGGPTAAGGLGGGPPGAQGEQGGPPQPPAPTHQQTVTALRHFGAIEKEAHGLLTDPDCGKADMRSRIIDGAARLVGMGMMSPPEAVNELAGVPDRPFEQKKWLEMQYAQAINAQTAILAHHAEAFFGQDDVPGGSDAPNQDDHQTIMAGLLQHYKDRGHA